MKHKIIISSLLISMVAGNAQAKRTDKAILKYSNCPGLEIKEPKNSNGFYMSGDCKTVNIVPPKSHELEVFDYKEIANNINCDEFAELERELNEVSRKSRIELDRFERIIAEYQTAIDLKGSIEGLTKDEMITKVDEYKDRIDKEISLADKRKASIKSDRSDIAGRLGARSKYFISDKTALLRDEFMELNPDAGVNFVSMTTTNSTIAYNSQNITTDDQGKRLGDILKIQIPLKTSTSADGQTESVNIGNGDLSGSIEYSMIGACVFRKLGLNPGDKFTLNQIENDIVINRFNEYTVHVNGGYTVKYNYGEIFKEIHRQTKKRGLFKNKTKNSKWNISSFNELITFESLNEEKNIGLTAQELNDVRKELISRAVLKVAAIQTGNPYTALQLLQPDAQNGADVAASELSKCYHLYCQIGAAGMKVLSGIFGSTKTVTEYEKKLNGKLEEVVDTTFPMSHFSTSTYR